MGAACRRQRTGSRCRRARHAPARLCLRRLAVRTRCLPGIRAVTRSAGTALDVFQILVGSTLGCLEHSVEVKRGLCYGATLLQGNAPVFELRPCLLQLCTRALKLAPLLDKQLQQINTTEPAQFLIGKRGHVIIFRLRLRCAPVLDGVPPRWRVLAVRLGLRHIFVVHRVPSRRHAVVARLRLHCILIPGGMLPDGFVVAVRLLPKRVFARNRVPPR